MPIASETALRKKTKAELIELLLSTERRVAAPEKSGSGSPPPRSDRNAPGDGSVRSSGQDLPEAELLTFLARTLSAGAYRRVLRADGSLEVVYSTNLIFETLFPGQYEPGSRPRLIDLMLPEFRPEWDRALQESADNLTRIDFEFPVRATSGEERWIRNIAAPFRTDTGEVVWDGLVIDITERKRNAENLRQSEIKFRDLTESALQGVLIHRDLKPLFVNKAYADMYGYDSPDELMEIRSTGDLVAEHDRQRLSDYHFDRLNGRDVPIRFEYQGIRKDGSLVWLENTSRNIEWEGAPAVQATVIDISDRKAAEIARAEAEKSLNSITENVPVGIIRTTCSGPERRVHTIPVNANKCLRETAGLGVFDPSNRASIVDLLSEEDRARGLRIVQSAAERFERIEVDFEFATPAGDRRWVKSLAAPHREADGSVVFDGLVIDITDQKRAENALRLANDRLEATVVSRTRELSAANEELRASERSLRDILERSPIGVAITSHARSDGRTKGKRLFVNDALVGMFGASSRDQLIEADISDSWVDPEEQNAATEFMLGGENLEDFEALRTRSDGSQWWVSMNTRPIRFDGQDCFMIWHFDVTERKRVEAALRESVEQHRLVTDSLPVMIAYVGADHRYRFINETGRRWFGLQRDDIIGHSVEEILPNDYPGFAPYMQSVLEGRDVTYENRVKFGDGQTRAIQVTFVPYITEDNTVDGYFSLVENVTERRQTEAALRQAQKMEAMGQLTGGVAHDFNNLLGIIVGNLGLADEQLGVDHPVRTFVEEANSAAYSGAGLTRQLLAFSRKQALNPRPLDLNEQMSEILGLLRRTLGETIEIDVRLDRDGSVVEVDQAQFEAMLLNLAVNARDAMPDGGSLTIETARVCVDEAFASSWSEALPGDYVLITVTDTGIGMPPEVLAQVFDPFFTTKDVGKGSGLGLSMVFGFTKQSGGHVEMESEVGVGTTAKIYLPLKQTVDTTREPEDEAAATARGETVGYDKLVLAVGARPIRPPMEGDAAAARPYWSSRTIPPCVR